MTPINLLLFTGRAPRRLLVLLALLLLASVLPSVAHAQPPTPPAPAAAPPAPPAVAPPATAAPSTPAAPSDAAAVEAKKAEARRFFEKGLALFDEQAWDAALVEFARSREIYATRAATKNAAFCLRRLHRFDEALEMYEALVRDYPAQAADEKANALKEIGELRGLVGSIVVRAAEPGATIAIAGRPRGTFPQGPIVVSAGTHVVRVYKDGFLPFETRVAVAGGQTTTVDAQLPLLTQAGRLRVTESSGQSVDVFVDGGLVGKTPWEGALAPGDHSVVLRGPGNLGSQPASAVVRLNQVTPLLLAVEELEASLRVEPTPTGASVSIDGIPVGRGVWDGKLRPGPHQIGLSGDGFAPEVLHVDLVRGARKTLSPALQGVAGRGGRFVLEVDGGPAFMPLVGGDVVGGCSGACSPGLAIGFEALAHGTFELANGFGFGVEAGYLRTSQTVDGRSTTATARDVSTALVAKDVLTIGGFVIGASAGYRFDLRVPLELRVGAGAMFGSVTDTRSAHDPRIANATDGEVLVQATGATSITDSTTAVFAFVSPELRAGYKIGEHLELSLGATAFLLFATKKPTWGDASFLVVNKGGSVGSYPTGSTTGSTLVAIVPSVGARYAF